MARADTRDGPRADHPGDRIISTKNAAARRVCAAIRVTGGPVNQEVAAKLWRLHWDHGYFTRAEIEAALGLDTPPGRWQCPGQFGADGRWSPCCRKGAAA